MSQFFASLEFIRKHKNAPLCFLAVPLYQHTIFFKKITSAESNIPPLRGGGIVVSIGPAKVIQMLCLVIKELFAVNFLFTQAAFPFIRRFRNVYRNAHKHFLAFYKGFFCS